MGAALATNEEATPPDDDAAEVGATNQRVLSTGELAAPPVVTSSELSVTISRVAVVLGKDSLSGPQRQAVVATLALAQEHNAARTEELLRESRDREVSLVMAIARLAQESGSRLWAQPLVSVRSDETPQPEDNPPPTLLATLSKYANWGNFGSIVLVCIAGLAAYTTERTVNSEARAETLEKRLKDEQGATKKKDAEIAELSANLAVCSEKTQAEVARVESCEKSRTEAEGEVERWRAQYDTCNSTRAVPDSLLDCQMDLGKATAGLTLAKGELQRFKEASGSGIDSVETLNTLLSDCRGEKRRAGRLFSSEAERRQKCEERLTTNGKRFANIKDKCGKKCKDVTWSMP